MREWHVVIGDLVEELDLVLSEQQCCRDGVDGCIPPSLVEEATVLVELVEVVEVCLRAKEVQIPNFEIRPLKRKC